MSPKATPQKQKVSGKEVALREAPKERENSPKDFLAPVMSQVQMQYVIGKTPAWAIKKRQGGGGRMLSYVPHGYVTDALNKLFGFDWDLVITPVSGGKMYELQFETIEPDPRARNAKPREVRHIAVSGYIEARIHGNPNNKKEVTATLRKSGFGSQIWLPTMEFGDALKAATSDLLKVCASKIGIANDLYWDEQAEYNNYMAKEQADIIDAVATPVMPPTNIATLIARAQTELGMKFDEVQKVLGLDADTIMAGLPEQAQAFWDKLQGAKNGS